MNKFFGWAIPGFLALICVIEFVGIIRLKRAVRYSPLHCDSVLRAAEGNTFEEISRLIRGAEDADWWAKVDSDLHRVKAARTGERVPPPDRAAAYREMALVMSNSFKPIPFEGVVIKGRVQQIDFDGAVTVECDRAPGTEQLLIHRANQVFYTNGSALQQGHCILRGAKGFGVSGRVDVIGDDMRFFTFTNRSGQVWFSPSYKVRGR